MQMVSTATQLKIFLLLGRIAMSNLDCFKKQRHHFANKGTNSQSYGFSGSHVWIWELDHKEKKTEHQRIDAFELCYWRRHLRIPWTPWRSSKSILKEINPEYSLEVLMLKIQYLGHLRQKAGSLEKALMLGTIEGKRRGNSGWDGSMTSLTQWTWVWTNLRRQWWTEKPGMLQSMGLQRVGHGLLTELQQQVVFW